MRLILLEWLFERILSLALWVSNRLLRIILKRKKLHRGGLLYVRTLGVSSPKGEAADRLNAESRELIQTQAKDLLKAVGFGHAWVDSQGNDYSFFLRQQEDAKPEEALAGALAFAVGLQAKAREQQLRLAMALDWEPAARIDDIGHGPFLVGRAANNAQLLISFADSDHVFVSEGAHILLKTLLANGTAMFEAFLDVLTDDLRKLVKDQMSESVDDMVCCFDRFTLHDRRKRPHDLFNFYIKIKHEGDGLAYVGSPVKPRERVSIEYRDAPMFRERLVDADEVCIIALTHENTRNYLDDALKARKEKGFWRQLTLVFPSEGALKGIQEKDRTPQQRLKRARAGKKDIMTFLAVNASDCSNQFQCLEYDGSLPFVGNQFVGSDGASIRVAPILPGADLKETFYVESFRGTTAYAQLDAAFAVICNKSTPIMEWDVYGQCDETGVFCMEGIVHKLRARRELGHRCFPVVLIILHAEVRGRHVVLLQKRDFYNATDNFGTYSNISGVVTDRDVCLGEKKSIPIYETVSADPATGRFWELTGLEAGYQLSESVWKCAAVREIKEELGLDVAESRLVPHSRVCFGAGDCKTCSQKVKVFFTIYSLALTHGVEDELQSIDMWRPHASLDSFHLGRLRQCHADQEFNSLLQTRFDDVFWPIFEEIGISAR